MHAIEITLESLLALEVTFALCQLDLNYAVLEGAQSELERCFFVCFAWAVVRL